MVGSWTFRDMKKKFIPYLLIIVVLFLLGVESSIVED